jgi:hypothetical protein
MAQSYEEKRRKQREYRKANIEKVRQQARDFYKRNSKKIIAQTSARSAAERDFRDSLLSQFPCVTCGNPDPTVIEWHHVDPSNKSFGIRKFMLKPHEEWWDEVLKCIPVCANCHKKIHKNKLCLLPQKL